MRDGLYSISSEQAVLGSMLLDSSCIRQAAQKLRESDFSMELNRLAFRTLLSMDAEGMTVDPMTAAAELKKAGQPEDQTYDYLRQLLEVTPTAANVMEYADIVAERGRRRALVEAMRNGAEDLEAGEEENVVLPRVEAAISETVGRSESELLSPGEQVSRFYEHLERLDGGSTPYIRTGFRTLDKMMPGGLQDSGLYFVAARPGVGKTAIAISIAEYVAKTQGTVVFVSMEMSETQITARRISALARLDSSLILTEKLTEEEYRKASEASREIGRTPLYVTDGRAYPVARISAIARSRKDCRLVVVDHFSLIPIPGRQSSPTEYAAVAHALKRLAQAMNAPVLCLAQLNRDPEQRSDKRPKLSDLRATGAAEEDADGVILLHRPDYYEKSDGKKDDTAPVSMELYLAKNRHGRTGMVTLSYWPKTNTFREAFVK